MELLPLAANLCDHLPKVHTPMQRERCEKHPGAAAGWILLCLLQFLALHVYSFVRSCSAQLVRPAVVEHNWYSSQLSCTTGKARSSLELVPPRRPASDHAFLRMRVTNPTGGLEFLPLFQQVVLETHNTLGTTARLDCLSLRTRAKKEKLVLWSLLDLPCLYLCYDTNQIVV